LTQSPATDIASGAMSTLTASVEDGGGNIVSTGPDSTPSIVFSQVSGTGTVTGLGTVVAVAGVATITVTGGNVGTVGVSAASSTLTATTLGLTVDKSNQTITFPQPAVSAVYGTTFTASPTSSSGAQVSLAAGGGCSVAAAGAAFAVTMTSGTVNCTLTASQAGDPTHNAATNFVRTVTAAKASQAQPTLDGASSGTYGSTYMLTYGGGSGTGDVTFSATGAACSVGSSTSTSTQVTMLAGAGSCTVTAIKAADSNFSARPYSHSMTATPAQLEVNAHAATKVYGGVDPTLNWSLAGFIGADDQANSNLTGSPSCTRTAGESVGTWSISCIPGTLAAPNYSFMAGTSATFGITTANLLITASNAAITYGDASPVITPHYAGLANGDSAPAVPPICLTTAGPATDVGTYSSTCSGAADDDYLISYAPGFVAVAVASQTIDFTQPAQPADFDSTFVVAPTASSGLDVTVSASGGCTAELTSPDWTVTMTSGTDDCVLVATQFGNVDYTAATSVERTVSASQTFQSDGALTGPADVTYGDTAQYTASGGSGTGAWTFDLGADSVCDIDSTSATTVTIRVTAGVGSCQIVATHAGDSNYRGESAGASVTADPRVLNVDGTSASKVYGASDPTPGFALRGFALGDDSSVASGTADCQRIPGESVGDYVVTCAPGDLRASNYSFATGVAGQLSITPAALNITASDAQIHFGDPGPSITPLYSGLENGDSAPSTLPICITTVTSTDPPGAYPSECSGVADANYTIDYSDGVVTVLKALQTITFSAPATTGVFGTSFVVDPTTSSSLTVSLAATGGCSATSDSSGWLIVVTSGSTDCVLTAAQAGDSEWEAASDAVQTVQVVRMTQDVVVVSAVGSATYGATLTATVSGGSGLGVFVLGGSGGCAAIGSDSLRFTAATPCTITGSRMSDANYAAASTSITLEVSPATLLVNAASETKTASDPDPALLATTSGFVLGDTSALVSGTANCTRDSGESAGSYVITCVAGTLAAPNYVFVTGATGSLTISAPESTKSKSSPATGGRPEGRADSTGGSPFSLTSMILPIGLVLLLIILVGGGIFLVRRWRGI
jgi:hypothetical protein